MHRQQFTGRAQPYLIAGEIVTGNLHVRTGKESDPNMLAVRDRSSTGKTVEGVFLFERCGKDDALPQDRAVAAIEADQDALAFIFEAGGDENPVAPDDGRGMPLAGDGRFPAEVFGFAPGKRESLLV